MYFPILISIYSDSPYKRRQEKENNYSNENLHKQIQVVIEGNIIKDGQYTDSFKHVFKLKNDKIINLEITI